MIDTIIQSIIVFLFGIVVARFLYDILLRFLKEGIGIEEYLKKKRLEDAIFGMDISMAIAYIISIYIFLYYARESLKILGMFYSYLDTILNYYPLFIYTFILTIFSLFISEIARRFVIKSKIPFSDEEGLIAKYVSFFVIFYLGLEVIGIKLEILSYTIKLIIASILFAFSLAFGIGYGLAISERLKGRR